MPFTVKSLTGNVELIKTLNRFGHGVSYSKLLEIDTAFAIQKINETVSDNVILPDEIHIYHPTTLVYDNIDRLEETLSGTGTSHRINGIAIQKGFIGPLPSRKRTYVPKTKRCSLEVEHSQITPYHAGARPNPPFLQGVPHLNVEARKKNSLCIISRYKQGRCQTIPSWTGFNILLNTNIMVVKDNIGYLPTINSPATSLSTIHKILCQALPIKDQLEVNDVVLVCDQAIAKAMEVAWSHTEKFQPVILKHISHDMYVFSSNLQKIWRCWSQRYRDRIRSYSRGIS